MIRIPGGSYFTVDQFRQRCGFRNAQPIYRAIQDGRLVGVIAVGDIYLIPAGSVIIDNKLKTGGKIRVKRLEIADD